jgi:hypothetical protein
MPLDRRRQDEIQSQRQSIRHQRAIVCLAVEIERSFHYRFRQKSPPFSSLESQTKHLQTTVCHRLQMTSVNSKLVRQPRPFTTDLLNSLRDALPGLLRVQSMPIRIGPIQRRHKINKGTSTFGQNRGFWVDRKNIKVGPYVVGE